VGKKDGEGGTNGTGELKKGKVEKRGKRRKRRGDGVSPPSAELMVERARREHHRLGLFTGQLGRCLGDEIFLTTVLIHHAATWLTSSSHITMASDRSCTRRSCLDGYFGCSTRW
jgi:hypothetical protein